MFASRESTNQNVFKKFIFLLGSSGNSGFLQAPNDNLTLSKPTPV